MSVHVSRVQAREVDDLIEREAIPHASRDEFVRDAVTRRLHEIKSDPRRAPAPSEGAGTSGFVADPATVKPRLDAAVDPRSAPGFGKPRAAGDESGSVA